MALSFLRKAEQENLFPSCHSVPNVDDKVDDKLIDASMFNATKPNNFVRACTLSQDECTSIGDDDFSSVYSVAASITSKDSEASDDEKSLSPRDATSCVYSIMLLCQVRAACCGRTCRSGQRSVLGYRTEPRPSTLGPTFESESSHKPRKMSSRSSKASKPRAGAATPLSSEGSAGNLWRGPALPASTAESWVTKQRERGTSGDDDATVMRAARSILNKLTIEKFDNLFDQLVACGIQTPGHISLLMREVFEKATTQHQFIPMYAELCVRLESDPHIASAAMKAGHLHGFRRLLLNQCQDVFEQLLEPCAKETTSDEEARVQRKKEALGNIKLIGELLVQGMLSSALFVELCKELLQKRTTIPEALEYLAALVMVAGPKFDVKDWRHHAGLEVIFSDMGDLTRDKPTPPRVRFLLRDVLDVRKAGWCTSANQAALKAAPMKLEQVREKAAEEQKAPSPKHQNKSNQGINKLIATMNAKTGGKLKKQKPMNSGQKLDFATLCRNELGKGHQEHKLSCSKDELVETIVAPLGATSDDDCSSDSPMTPSSQTPSTCASINEDLMDEVFDLVNFRRALSATLTKLVTDRNVPAAVQYIRLQHVPIEYQADEFADIISRIVEERRGAVRRCEFAFAAGLMASEHSPFDQQACLDGIRNFFQDVYLDLCNEVQRLPAIIKSEFLPIMNRMFSASELNMVLPEAMHQM